LPLGAVREEWRRRVLAEYGSAAITSDLVGWLLRLGASPTLLHHGLRIADDEVVHAELAFEVLSAAGGGEVELGGRALGLEPLQELPLASNACLAGVRVFCLGETVAVRLFKRLRDGATIDPARRALDRVLGDEVRHRDFGWLLLEWFAGRTDWLEQRELLRARLPEWFAGLRRNYEVEDASFDEADRAWGLMPTSEYRAALYETLDRDYIPRFEEYEIDARAAFDDSRP
jgi:hypothetical protein